jgi:hypothetical protein
LSLPVLLALPLNYGERAALEQDHVAVLGESQEEQAPMLEKPYMLQHRADSQDVPIAFVPHILDVAHQQWVVDIEVAQVL